MNDFQKAYLELQVEHLTLKNKILEEKIKSLSQPIAVYNYFISDGTNPFPPNYNTQFSIN